MSPARKRVVVTDLRFEGLAHERAAAERHGASFQEFDCHDEAGVVDALRDADIAFVNLVQVTEAALAGMRADGLVVRYGIGTDNVDVDAARRLGIRVANVPDYGSDTVADHASASMLALLRRLPMFDAAIRHDGWINPDTVGHLPSLSATTVGLVGVGRIGLLVARRLQAFGIRILATDPFADADALRAANVEAVSLETLLGDAHGISLHLPATPATRHIIGPASIGRMRRGAMLVNTARGALVDETALAEALGDGRLGGAALDVFDPEPLAPNSPLRTLSNVILTPHAAFYSVQSLEALQRLASEEAARALAGEPLRSRIA
ncbi:C-terminal binding protein [Lichenicola cladoniae]|uniref:C-terminal binding protein n=1 Tax=Lichenicola cladoniae TaxID=1484109 RepID=A0A6M8HTM2_9PROT|nr:C-terminal binding protein [Lichenicola cladoniae]NPD67768.1 C-terminal binding protein [Acetobacteraceae bacterium]QKE91692.1 C-terminal binding protein [Lichenicola cladoniae]